MDLNKDSQINVVLNTPDSEEDTIDLGRVFHNVKLKSRIYAWVLVLCMLVGVCAPLVLYQFNKPVLTVSSVVTLRYNVPNPEYETAKKRGDTLAMQDLEPELPVEELVTPEGEDLDLNALTSSSVLQQAVGGLALSHPVTLENLRNNITVTRIMTDDSSRTQEILSGLAAAKDSDVYARLERASVKYKNRFVVSLKNGFGDEDANVKFDLKDEELTLILNRVLDAYNTSLVQEWADLKLPEDEISVIDTAEMDLPETLDSLKTALANLYNYCETRSETVKGYRSWRTGLSLNDWMDSLKALEEGTVDSLDAYVFARGLMRDRDSVRLTFRYRLRTLQSDLDKVNETIESNAKLLQDYKNNDVYVSMQESESARTTKMTTAYYNDLVVKQQEAYDQAAQLRIQIAEVQNKLDRLETSVQTDELAAAEEELSALLETSLQMYGSIKEHMEELFETPLYTTYTEHSAPQGEVPNFLKSSWKKMLIGAAAGAVVACGLWFLAALAPEFRRNRKDDDAEKEAAEA